MTGRGKKPAAAPRKKANGYKMPAPIPSGEVIHDTVGKKKWRIGPSIGVGGFGEIYSACDHESSPKKGSAYPFVVKIEPHENGPLFVEKHFYIRNANKDDIAQFMKGKKLSSFGMPTYFGNGSHDFKGEKYRYLVLERYGKDIWTLFKECGRCFPQATVFQLGLQMLDVLEYIHSRNYVHADIKGANILLGMKKGTENQAYLVDFGLATRVNDKEFKPDPKCAHNGTIEYTSRDAHLGVATMRGDLEILGYNMLQWLVGELPWEKNLKQPKVVQDMKEAFMKNVRSNMKKYPNVPDALTKFFEYINTLKPKDVPDYTKCRSLFETYLKSQGKNRYSKLDFAPDKKGKSKAANNEDSEKEEDKPAKKRAPKENGDIPKAKKAKKAKETVVDSSTENGENEEPDDSRPKVSKKRVVRQSPSAKKTKKATEDINTDSATENNDSEDDSEPKAESRTKPKVVKRKVKRKSLEPSVVVKLKKTKLAPKATPPVKKNHVNIATQTSTDRLRGSPRRPKVSPRQVSFDSPICAVLGDKRAAKISKDSTANSSGDIFEDSFVIEEKKVKGKKRLMSEEEIVVKRVVKKKVTAAQPKAKSWKDLPTVVNGRSPPK